MALPRQSLRMLVWACMWWLAITTHSIHAITPDEAQQWRTLNTEFDWHQSDPEASQVRITGRGVEDTDGNLYFVGSKTYANDDGTFIDDENMFVARIDADDSLGWTKEFGTNESDGANFISIMNETVAGVLTQYLYVVGWTWGFMDEGGHALNGFGRFGGRDVVLIKLTLSGNKVWARQFGSSVDDMGYGVQRDGVFDNLLLTGTSVAAQTSAVMEMQISDQLEPREKSLSLYETQLMDSRARASGSSPLIRYQFAASFSRKGDLLDFTMDGGVTLAGRRQRIAENSSLVGEYAVVLNRKPLNDVSVVITLVGQRDPLDDTTIVHQLRFLTTAKPTWTLRFTRENWNREQLVRVQAVDDAIAEGIHYSMVSHATSSLDPNFNGPNTPFLQGTTLTLQIEDNDLPGINLSRRHLFVAEGDSTGDTYDIVLHSRPWHPVYVTIVSLHPEQAMASPAVVTFQPETWNISQTIQVLAVDDTQSENEYGGLHFGGQMLHYSTSKDRRYHTRRPQCYDVPRCQSGECLTDQSDTERVRVCDVSSTRCVGRLGNGACISQAIDADAIPTGNFGASPMLETDPQDTEAASSVMTYEELRALIADQAKDAHRIKGDTSYLFTPPAPELRGFVLSFLGLLNLGQAREVQKSYQRSLHAVCSGLDRLATHRWASEVWPRDSFARVLNATLEMLGGSVQVRHLWQCGFASFRPGGSSINVSIWDNDPGVTLSSRSLSVKETDDNSSSDSYSIVLNAPPSSDSAVLSRAFCSSPQSDFCGLWSDFQVMAASVYSLPSTAPLSNISIAILGTAQVVVSPSIVTFTTANWFVPQQITVRAVDDQTAESDIARFTIGHRVQNSSLGYGDASTAFWFQGASQSMATLFPRWSSSSEAASIPYNYLPNILHSPRHKQVNVAIVDDDNAGVVVTETQPQRKVKTRESDDSDDDWVGGAVRSMAFSDVSLLSSASNSDTSATLGAAMQSVLVLEANVTTYMKFHLPERHAGDTEVDFAFAKLLVHETPFKVFNSSSGSSSASSTTSAFETSYQLRVTVVDNDWTRKQVSDGHITPSPLSFLSAEARSIEVTTLLTKQRSASIDVTPLVGLLLPMRLPVVSLKIEVLSSSSPGASGGSSTSVTTHLCSSLFERELRPAMKLGYASKNRLASAQTAQSSTVNDASLAIDGDRGSEASLTLNETGPWWEATIPVLRRLGSLAIFVAEAMDSGRVVSSPSVLVVVASLVPLNGSALTMEEASNIGCPHQCPLIQRLPVHKSLLITELNAGVRSIRIYLDGAGVLALREVEAFDPHLALTPTANGAGLRARLKSDWNGRLRSDSWHLLHSTRQSDDENVARGMMTRQSSTDPPQAVSSLAVDGQHASQWDPLLFSSVTDGDGTEAAGSTRTEAESNPWLEIDLGSVTPISQVILYPYIGTRGRSYCQTSSSYPAWSGDLLAFSKTDELLQLADPFEQTFDVVLSDSSLSNGGATIVRKSLAFSCAGGVTYVTWSGVFAKARYVTVMRLGSEAILMLNEVVVTRWNPATTPQYVLLDLRGSGEKPMALSSVQLFGPTDEQTAASFAVPLAYTIHSFSSQRSVSGDGSTASLLSATDSTCYVAGDASYREWIVLKLLTKPTRVGLIDIQPNVDKCGTSTSPVLAVSVSVLGASLDGLRSTAIEASLSAVSNAACSLTALGELAAPSSASASCSSFVCDHVSCRAAQVTSDSIVFADFNDVVSMGVPTLTPTTRLPLSQHETRTTVLRDNPVTLWTFDADALQTISATRLASAYQLGSTSTAKVLDIDDAVEQSFFSNAVAVQPAMSAFSIELWLQLTSAVSTTTTVSLVTLAAGASKTLLADVSLAAKSPNGVFNVYNPSTGATCSVKLPSSPAVFNSTDRWYHALATYDPSNARIGFSVRYLSSDTSGGGVAASSGSTSCSLPLLSASDKFLQLGAFGSTPGFVGRVTNVAWYVAVLSDRQALDHFHDFMARGSHAPLHNSYALQLASKPETPVLVEVNAETACYYFSLCNVTVLPRALAFTPENWNVRQHVRVIATDDQLYEGSHTTVIVHRATSAPSYEQQSVVLTEDLADTDLGLWKQYKAARADYDRVAVFTSGLATEIESARLVLAEIHANWSSQTLTSSYVKRHAYTEELVIKNVTVNIEDATVPGIQFSTNSLLVSESGRGNDYQILLLSEPTDDVRVVLDVQSDCYRDCFESPLCPSRMVDADNDLGCGGGPSAAKLCNITVSPDVLVFTPANWSYPQTVRVLAIDDRLDEADVHMTTIKTTSKSLDPIYDALFLPDIVVAVEDNDDTAIDYSVLAVALNESETTGTNYQLTLMTEPWANVTIAMSNEADGSCYRPCGYAFDEKDCGLPRQQSVSSVRLATDSPREIHEIRLALPRPRVMEVQRLATFTDHVDHVYSVRVAHGVTAEVQEIEFAFDSAFKARYKSAQAVATATTYLKSFKLTVAGRTAVLDGFATAAQVETALNSLLVGRSPGKDTSQVVEVTRTLLYEESILRWQIRFVRFVASDLSFPIVAITTEAAFEGTLTTKRVSSMALPTGTLQLTYGGEAAAIELAASESDIEASLRDLSIVYTVSVSRSIDTTSATSTYALLYGITFTSVDRYDMLTASGAELISASGTPVAVLVTELQQPVQIDGMFVVRYDSPYINASANVTVTETEAIPWNATEDILAAELAKLDGVGVVTVARRTLSSEGAMDWTVAFVENNGNLPLLEMVSVNLTGKGVYTEVTSVLDGVSLGGGFTVEMGGELIKTHPTSKRVYVVSTDLRNTTLLSFNVSADEMALALAVLNVTEQPNVTRVGVDCDIFDVCEGYTWTISYIDSAGNLPPIQVYGTNTTLEGHGAMVDAKTVANGTYLSGFFSLTLELEDKERNVTHRATTWNLPVNVSTAGMDEALEAIRFVRSNREAEFDPETRVSRGWQFDKGVRVKRDGPYLDGGHTWRLEWAIEDYVRFQDLRITVNSSLVTQLIEPLAVPSALDLANKPRCDAIPHARFQADQTDPFQLRGFCVYDVVATSIQERFLCNYTVENPWIVFTPQNWCVPQAVELTAVDDYLDEATVKHDNTTFSNVTHTVFSDDLIYSALPLEQVVVAVESDDFARVVVSESHLDVSEDGAVTASYALSLTTEPLYDVKIVVLPWLDSADTKCYRFGLCNLTLDVDTYVFTPRDWNIPQRVLVRATDDDLDEDDTHPTGISHKSYSDDLKYDQREDIPKIQVAVADNDDSAFYVSRVSVNVTEGDATGDEYQVVLGSEPFAKVTVSIQNVGVKGNFATAMPNQLVFTWRNWNISQTVLVTAVDDDTQDPIDSSSVLVHSIRTNDVIYSQLKDLGSVKVWIQDNDVSDIALSTSAMDVRERPSPYSYAVRLTSEPWFPVTVTPNGSYDCYIREVTQDRVCNVTVMTNALYFGAANWSEWQSISFLAFDDALEETPVHYGRITHASASKDPLYAVSEYTSIEDVLQLSIEDNDVSFVDISLTVANTATRTRLHVAEGGFNDTYTIKLASEPYEDVLVTVRPRVDRIVSIDSAVPPVDSSQVHAAMATHISTQATGFFTLVFSPLDWSNPRVITVYAVDDEIPEDPTQLSAIEHECESADSKYNISNSSIGIVDVAVLISDREAIPPPLPTSALFDATGARILVSFDSTVYHAATMDTRTAATGSAYVARFKSFSCSLLFSSSVDALGTGATCSWSLNLAQLRIDLGAGATIVPGSMLLLYDCAIFVNQICQSESVLRARHTSRAYTQATITVRVNPSEVVKPKVILNAPEQVGSCGVWSVDGSLSTGSAGREYKEQMWFALPRAAVSLVAVSSDLWYTKAVALYAMMALPCADYELGKTVAITDLASDLKVFIESLDQLKAACHLRSVATTATGAKAMRLQVNSAQLQSGTKYVVGLSLENAFSQQTIGVHTVSVKELPSPLVTAVGETHLQISRGESTLPVTLQGNASLDCLDLWGANAHLSYRWLAAVYSTEAGSSTSVTIDLNSTNTAKDPRVFRVPRSVLQAGKTYTLRLEASAIQISGQTSTGSISFTVTVGSSALVAEIRGGDRNVGEKDALVLDASPSLDPDASLQLMWYAWKCEDLTNETLVAQPCVNASSPALGAIQLPSPATALLAIDPFTLQPKRTLRFTLTVSKTNDVTQQTRSATTHTMVWTMPGSVPAVSIVASAAKINPSSRITLTATVKSTYPATGRWLEDEGDLHLPDAASNITTHDAFSLPLTSPSLAILRNKLTAGQRYVLRYLATDVNGNAGFGLVTFTVNAPPLPGTFDISPRVGDAVTDRFTLDCRQWTDDVSDLPLQYAFGVLPTAVFTQLEMNMTSIRRRMQPLVAEQLSPTASVTMLPPEGLMDAADVTVITFIVDSMGSTAMAYDSIVVNMPPAAKTEPVAFVTTLLSGSGDVRELFSAALVMQRAMTNAATGECPSTSDGTCSGHGVCDVATAVCVCESEYMGPACQFLVAAIREVNAKILSSLDDSSVQNLEPSASGLAQQVSVFGTVVSSSAAAIDGDALGQITSLSSSVASTALTLQDSTTFLESTGESLVGALSSALTIRSSLPSTSKDARRRLTTSANETSVDCSSTVENEATQASFRQVLASLQSLVAIASEQLLPDEAPAELTTGEVTMVSAAGSTLISKRDGLVVTLTSVATACLSTPSTVDLFVNAFQLPATSHSACTLHDASPLSRSTIVTVHNKAAVAAASSSGHVNLLSLAGSSLCVAEASAKAAADSAPQRRLGSTAKWTPLVALTIPHARALTTLEQRNFSTACRSWDTTTSAWVDNVCFKDDTQSSAMATVCYCGELLSPLEVLVSLEERLDFYALTRDVYRDDSSSIVGAVTLVILLGLFAIGGQLGRRLDVTDEKREKDKTIKSLNRTKWAELQDRATKDTTVREEFAAFLASHASEKAKAQAAEAMLEMTAPVVTATPTDEELDAVELPNEARVLFGSTEALQQQNKIVTTVVQVSNALLAFVGVVAIAVGLDFALVLANTTSSALVLVVYGQPIGITLLVFGGVLLLCGSWGLWLTRHKDESSVRVARSMYAWLLLALLIGQLFFVLLAYRYIDDLSVLPSPALQYLASVWDALSASRKEELQSLYGCCGLASTSGATSCPEEAFDTTPPRTCLRVIQADARSLFRVSFVYLQVLVLVQLSLVVVLRAIRRWRRLRLRELVDVESLSTRLLLRGSSVDVALLCLAPSSMEVTLSFVAIVLFNGVDLLAGLHVLNHSVVTALIGLELGVAVVVLAILLSLVLLYGVRAMNALDASKVQVVSVMLTALVVLTMGLLATIDRRRNHWLLDPAVVNLIRRRYIGLPRKTLVQLELAMDCCGFDAAHEGACDFNDQATTTCHTLVLSVLHHELQIVSHRVVGIMTVEALLLLLTAVISLRAKSWAKPQSNRRVQPLETAPLPLTFSESLVHRTSLTVLSLASAAAVALGLVVVGAGLDVRYELNVLHLAYLLRVFDRHVATYLLAGGGAITAFGGLGIVVAYSQRPRLAWLFVFTSGLLFLIGLAVAGISHRYSTTSLNDAAMGERLETLWMSSDATTTRVFLQNAMQCCGFERLERANGTVVFTGAGEWPAWHADATSRRLTSQTICPVAATDGCVQPLRQYVKTVATRAFQLAMALVTASSSVVAAVAGLLWRSAASPPLPWAASIARAAFCLFSGGLMFAALGSLALGVDVASEWSLLSSAMLQLMFPRSIGVAFFAYAIMALVLNVYAVEGAVRRTVHRVFVQSVVRVVLILGLLLCVALTAYASHAHDLRGFLSRQWDALSPKTQHRISLEFVCCGFDDPAVVKGKGLVFDRPAVGYKCGLAAARGCRTAMESQLHGSFTWLFHWLLAVTLLETAALMSGLVLLRGLQKLQSLAWFAIESRLRFAAGRYKRELRRHHVFFSVLNHFDRKYTRGQRLMSVLCGMATSLAVYATWFARHGCHRHALKTCVQPDVWGYLGMGVLYGGCVGFAVQLAARALFKSVRNRSDDETQELVVTRQRKEKALLFRGLFGRGKATTPVSGSSLLEPPVHSTTEERWYAWLSRFVHAVYAAVGVSLFLFGCGLAIVMAMVALGWQRTLYGVALDQGPRELMGLGAMVACAALMAWLAMDRKQRGSRGAVLFVVVAILAVLLLAALGLALFMVTQTLEDDSNWTVRNTGFSMPQRLQAAWNSDVSGYFRNRVQRELQCCGFKDAQDNAVRPCPTGTSVVVDYKAVRVDGSVVTSTKDEVRDLGGCYGAMLGRFHAVVDGMAYVAIGVGAALVLLATSALFLAREVVISKDSKLKLRVPSADVRQTFEKVVGLKIAAPARGKILSKMLSTSLETVAPHVASELAAEPLQPVTLPNGHVVSPSLTTNRWDRAAAKSDAETVPFPAWVASAMLWLSFVWVAVMCYIVVLQSLELGVATAWHCIGAWIVGVGFHLWIVEPLAVLVRLLGATLGEWWATSRVARLWFRLRSARVSAEQRFYASLTVYEKIRYNAAMRIQRRLLTRLARRRFLQQARETRERQHQQRVAQRRVALQQAIDGFTREEVEAFALLFRDADTAQLGLVPSPVIAQAVYQLGVSVDAALVREFLVELDPAYADLVDLEHFLYGMHCVRVHHQAQQEQAERTRAMAVDEREAARVAAAEQLVSSSTRFGPRADPQARVVVKRQNLLRELREKRESLSYRLLSKVGKLPPLLPSRAGTGVDSDTADNAGAVVAVEEQEEAQPTGAYVLLQNRKLSPKKRALEMVLKRKSREDKEGAKPASSSPRKMVMPTLRLPGSPRKHKAEAVSAAEATRTVDVIVEETEAEAASPLKTVETVKDACVEEEQVAPAAAATVEAKPFGTFMLLAKQAGSDGKAKVLEKLQAAKASPPSQEEDAIEATESEEKLLRPSTAEKRERATDVAKTSLEKALKKKAQTAKPAKR